MTTMKWEHFDLCLFQRRHVSGTCVAEKARKRAVSSAVAEKSTSRSGDSVWTSALLDAALIASVLVRVPVFCSAEPERMSTKGVKGLQEDKGQSWISHCQEHPDHHYTSSFVSSLA